jgi:hypothetical protein
MNKEASDLRQHTIIEVWFNHTFAVFAQLCSMFVDVHKFKEQEVRQRKGAWLARGEPAAFHFPFLFTFPLRHVPVIQLAEGGDAMRRSNRCVDAHPPCTCGRVRTAVDRSGSRPIRSSVADEFQCGRMHAHCGDATNDEHADSSGSVGNSQRRS